MTAARMAMTAARMAMTAARMAMTAAPTEPSTIEQAGTGTVVVTLPPYRLLLHNDEVNSMDHVVQALLKSVPELAPEEAVAVMLEAHAQGVALVIVCPLERAELYRDRLQGQGLTATIEPG